MTVIQSIVIKSQWIIDLQERLSCTSWETSGARVHLSMDVSLQAIPSSSFWLSQWNLLKYFKYQVSQKICDRLDRSDSICSSGNGRRYPHCWWDQAVLKWALHWKQKKCIENSWVANLSIFYSSQRTGQRVVFNEKNVQRPQPSFFKLFFIQFRRY